MIQLAKIFQNGMTLQRQKPIKLWGSTDCSQQVTVSLNGEPLLENEAIVGDFTLILPEQEAMTDAVLTISGSVDTVELSSVDIGEVWIASGQSNMEFLLRYDAEGKTQIANANDDHFRFYDVGEYTFPEEEEMGCKDNTGWDKWLTFKPQYAQYFSAVGVYFARQLRETLDVPVAIIGCNWGGTTASSWTEESYLASNSELKEYLDDYAKATENLEMSDYLAKSNAYLEFEGEPETAQIMGRVLEGNISTWEMIKAIPFILKMAKVPNPMGPRNPNAPGCLYRAMVKQVAGFTCRGVIWYQGESDDIKAQMYDKLFSTMIRCWRDTWQEELPFLFVQLAPFGKWMGATGDKYPILRQKQEIVSKTVPGCYMASIMDSGMEKDIHPKCKRPVGERLALLARGKIYGEDILCEAPEFQSANVEDGKLLLKFANVGSGLEIRGKNLNAIKIIVNGKAVKQSKVSAKGDTLTISADEIRKNDVIKVSFAWVAYCEVNLFSSAGLSAKPFEWNN